MEGTQTSLLVDIYQYLERNKKKGIQKEELRRKELEQPLVLQEVVLTDDVGSDLADDVRTRESVDGVTCDDVITEHIVITEHDIVSEDDVIAKHDVIPEQDITAEHDLVAKHDVVTQPDVSTEQGLIQKSSEENERKRCDNNVDERSMRFSVSPVHENIPFFIDEHHHDSAGLQVMDEGFKNDERLAPKDADVCVNSVGEPSGLFDGTEGNL